MTTAATQRDWMTTAEAAAELGKAAATIRQASVALTVGGYRVGRNWRFDRAAVLASKHQPVQLPATRNEQTLARQVADLIAVNRQRELEWEFKFRQLVARVARLERALETERIAA